MQAIIIIISLGCGPISKSEENVKPVPTKPSVRRYWWPSVNSVKWLQEICSKLESVLACGKMQSGCAIVRMFEHVKCGCWCWG